MEERTEAVYQGLQRLADPQKAADLQRFFKTGPGEYGEGDRFLGVSVPDQRKIVRSYRRQIRLFEIEQLIFMPYHECRMTALLLLTELFLRSSGEPEQREIVRWYVGHLDRVNNWDLVDTSCHVILGPWLLERDRSLLYKLAESRELWRQRIAVITTYHFIRNNEFTDTFALADLLLTHRHDLIHKAVGWMLREVGNRDPEAERQFLRTRYARMPRTMLRYAIEKFPAEERRLYLNGLIT